MRVLLVDDDRLMLSAVAGLLADLGCTVTTSLRAESALTLFAQPPFPELVVTDLHMPGMSGVVLARAVRAKLGGACPPIILLTASGGVPRDAGQLFSAVVDKTRAGAELPLVLARLGLPEAPR